MLTVRGSASFEGVLDGLSTLPPTGPVVIDLSAVSFIEPAGIAGIAALVDRAVVVEGRQVSFIGPTDSGVRNYLSRMRLGFFLDSVGVPHSLPTVHATPLASELLELTQFNGNDKGAGEGLGALVQAKLETAGVDPIVVDGLFAAISELVGNVEYHANVRFGYLAAQTTHKGQRISFAIADAGQGMKSSLAAYRPNDDANALALAVTANISGTGEDGRGQGLPDVVQNSTELQGTVRLASGHASAVHYPQSSQSKTRRSSYPGTLLQVELPCRPI